MESQQWSILCRTGSCQKRPEVCSSTVSNVGHLHFDSTQKLTCVCHCLSVKQNKRDLKNKKCFRSHAAFHEWNTSCSEAHVDSCIDNKKASIWWGGRIKQVAETDEQGILLCLCFCLISIEALSRINQALGQMMENITYCFRTVAVKNLLWNNTVQVSQLLFTLTTRGNFRIWSLVSARNWSWHRTFPGNF